MNNNVESKTQEFLGDNDKQFPENRATDLKEMQEKGEVDLSFRIRWVGPKNKDYIYVVCEVTLDYPPVNGVLPYTCYAVADRGKDNEPIRQEFVVFGYPRAYAVLEIPRRNYNFCTVRMERILTTPNRKKIQTFALVPLSNFNIIEKEIEYNIIAPAIQRQNADDKIRISYNANSSPDSYDYIYPGTSDHRMYFPTAGEIRVTGADICGMRMKLEVSDGSKTVEYDLDKPKKAVAKKERIEYEIDELWNAEKKLEDCFSRSTELVYRLILQVEEYSGSDFTIMITNDNKLIEMVSKDGVPSNVKRIPPITVNMD